MYERFGKRAIDIVVSATALVLLLPVIAAVALLVRWRLGTPVFFRQVRPGRDARLFEMIKFRTMTDQRDASGKLLPDAVRLKPFGGWLRSTSLDELPELWNVLRGEMSLVGPRPLLTKYLPLYSAEQARRHQVRPGVTGLAQVNGRNECGWEQRFEWDTEYVDTVSLPGDLAILYRTLAVVLLRRGISEKNHCTKSPFEGTPRYESRKAA